MTDLKIFGLYGTEGLTVSDKGLNRYISFESRLVIKSKGRNRDKFTKAKTNIVERLIGELSVPGHRGKKHKIMTKVSGKYTQQAKVIMETLKIILDKTKQNPVQIIINAIQNGSPRDEVTAIEYGGARYPQAVDCAPSRRISLALRNIVHGAQDKSFNKKKKISEALADEIIAASNDSNESTAVSKRIEIEKQADSAR